MKKNQIRGLKIGSLIEHRFYGQNYFAIVTCIHKYREFRLQWIVGDDCFHVSGVWAPVSRLESAEFFVVVR